MEYLITFCLGGFCIPFAAFTLWRLWDLATWGGEENLIDDIKEFFARLRQRKGE